MEKIIDSAVESLLILKDLFWFRTSNDSSCPPPYKPSNLSPADITHSIPASSSVGASPCTTTTSVTYSNIIRSKDLKNALKKFIEDGYACTVIKKVIDEITKEECNKVYIYIEAEAFKKLQTFVNESITDDNEREKIKQNLKRGTLGKHFTANFHIFATIFLRTSFVNEKGFNEAVQSAYILYDKNNKLVDMQTCAVFYGKLQEAFSKLQIHDIIDNPMNSTKTPEKQSSTVKVTEDQVLPIVEQENNDEINEGPAYDYIT